MINLPFKNTAVTKYPDGIIFKAFSAVFANGVMTNSLIPTVICSTLKCLPKSPNIKDIKREIGLAVVKTIKEGFANDR